MEIKQQKNPFDAITAIFILIRFMHQATYKIKHHISTAQSLRKQSMVYAQQRIKHKHSRMRYLPSFVI